MSLQGSLQSPMLLWQFPIQLGDDSLLPVTLGLALVTIFGAVIGSFLNVVIHRVPREESVVFPNSRCPACGAAIKFYDNIPIFGYLALRGRCRNCRAPISARYPAVEALTAVLFGLTFARDGLTLALIPDLVFVAAIIALVFIDAEHMILPNVITYPGLALALLARALLPNLYGLSFLSEGFLADWPAWVVSFCGALIGAIVGGGSLWLVGQLWEKLRGVEAMGLGDVKMMFMVGAYLGWPLTLLTIFVGVLLGSFAGVGLMAWRREPDMQMMLPFGIFLGLGSIVSLLAGMHIVNWYVSHYIT